MGSKNISKGIPSGTDCQVIICPRDTLGSELTPVGHWPASKLMLIVTGCASEGALSDIPAAAAQATNNDLQRPTFE
jgi:hypothetical protein